MMLATWCVRKLRGDARPSPYRVLSVAPGRRVWRARRSVCERLHDRQLITHRKETLLVEPVNVQGPACDYPVGLEDTTT